MRSKPESLSKMIRTVTPDRMITGQGHRNNFMTSSGPPMYRASISNINVKLFVSFEFVSVSTNMISIIAGGLFSVT